MKVMNKSHPIRCQVMLFMLLSGLLHASCLHTEEDEKKLDELRQVASETSVFPDFRETASNYMIKSNVVDLGFFYRSAASYDEVKSFYVKELNQKGWRLSSEEELRNEDRELIFRKGEYSIAIEYDSSATQGWDYAVTYIWKRL